MRKRLRNINFFIMFVTIFMGIGYASVFSVSLEVDGELVAIAPKGVFISDAKVIEGVNADLSDSIVNQVVQTMFNSVTTLSNIDINSTVTYEITVYNATSNDYIFSGVTYDSEFYSNDNIDFSLSNLSAGTIIKPFESITFNINFYYVSSIISNNVLESYLNFDFKEVHDVLYVDISNNSYPSFVINGDDLVVNFTDPVPTAVNVFLNDSLYDNFSYQNGVLIIYSVTGDVTISNKTADGYDHFIEEGNQIFDDESINDNINNNFTVTDLFSKTYIFANGSNSKVSSVKVTFNYEAVTGKTQTINCNLKVGDDIYTDVVTFSAKESANGVITFSNLDIGNNIDIEISFSALDVANQKIYINKVDVEFILS